VASQALSERPPPHEREGGRPERGRRHTERGDAVALQPRDRERRELTIAAERRAGDLGVEEPADPAREQRHAQAAGHDDAGLTHSGFGR